VEKIKMKKIVSAIALASAFATGAVLSAQVHDWHDLDAVHKHVIESLDEMQRARAANHYDMMGHGAKAEEHLRAAERELGLAIDASKASAR
jgi:Ni/Co efflux regulator RcnB